MGGDSFGQGVKEFERRLKENEKGSEWFDKGLYGSTDFESGLRGLDPNSNPISTTDSNPTSNHNLYQ